MGLIIRENKIKVNQEAPSDNKEGYCESCSFRELGKIATASVKEVDLECYWMLAGDVYIEKETEGEGIIVLDEGKTAELERLSDNLKRINIYTNRGKLERVYDCRYNDEGSLTEVNLTIAKGWLKGQDVEGHQVTRISIAEGVETGDIIYNTFLPVIEVNDKTTTVNEVGDNLPCGLVIGNGAKVGEIKFNSLLETLELGERVESGDIRHNRNLKTIKSGDGSSIGYIEHNNNNLETAQLGGGVIGIRHDNKLETIYCHDTMGMSTKVLHSRKELKIMPMDLPDEGEQMEMNI